MQVLKVLVQNFYRSHMIAQKMLKFKKIIDNQTCSRQSVVPAENQEKKKQMSSF